MVLLMCQSSDQLCHCAAVVRLISVYDLYYTCQGDTSASVYGDIVLKASAPCTHLMTGRCMHAVQSNARTVSTDHLYRYDCLP
jgi:hypothetical protein